MFGVTKESKADVGETRRSVRDRSAENGDDMARRRKEMKHVGIIRDSGKKRPGEEGKREGGV